MEPMQSEHPYDRLTPDLILRALEASGFRCDGRLLALNSYENRVYQVGIEDEAPVVAKFYRPGRWTKAAILEEHAFAHDGPEARAFSKEFMMKHPDRYADLSEVVDHFDHVISLVGANHVGIGSDFDGVGDTLPVGLKDVSEYPNLVAEFLNRGYSDEDIIKILGGNLMRVWREVEAYASQ